MTGSLEDIVGMAVFARVVEARLFTDAAKRLGLAKSAVSARVGRLEESVGVRLLHRTTRKLSLTEEGLAFYERCARLLAAADEAASVAEEAGGAPSGTLRVTAPLAFSQLHLAPALADFLAANPRVTVDLSAEDRLVDLVADGFDLAIRIGRVRSRPWSRASWPAIGWWSAARPAIWPVGASRAPRPTCCATTAFATRTSRPGSTGASATGRGRSRSSRSPAT